MISVTIKLHSAITGKTSILGRLLIWNTGNSGTKDRGDYGVAVLRKGQEDLFNEDDRKTWVQPPMKDRTRTGNVTNYPRLSYNVWRLVTRALKSAFPEEK